MLEVKLKTIVADLETTDPTAHTKLSVQKEIWQGNEEPLLNTRSVRKLLKDALNPGQPTNEDQDMKMEEEEVVSVR